MAGRAGQWRARAATPPPRASDDRLPSSSCLCRRRRRRRVEADPRTHCRQTCIDCELSTRKLPSIDDRGQTDRVQRPHAMDAAFAVGLGRATPHASARELAADDVTAETHYYAINHTHRRTSQILVFALTFDVDPR